MPATQRIVLNRLCRGFSYNSRFFWSEWLYFVYLTFFFWFQGDIKFEQRSGAIILNFHVILSFFLSFSTLLNINFNIEILSKVESKIITESSFVLRRRYKVILVCQISDFIIDWSYFDFLSNNFTLRPFCLFLLLLFFH